MLQVEDYRQVQANIRRLEERLRSRLISDYELIKELEAKFERVAAWVEKIQKVEDVLSKRIYRAENRLFSLDTNYVKLQAPFWRRKKKGGSSMKSLRDEEYVVSQLNRILDVKRRASKVLGGTGRGYIERKRRINFEIEPALKNIIYELGRLEFSKLTTAPEKALFKAKVNKIIRDIELLEPKIKDDMRIDRIIERALEGIAKTDTDLMATLNRFKFIFKKPGQLRI